MLVQLLSSTTAPGEKRLRPKAMEERLERIGNGELLQLWAERQVAAQTAGAQPAAAAPAAPEPTGHEDDCEARPGCHDRLWQSLFEEAMGGDAESGKVLRAVHKKVVDQQLGSALKLLGAAKSAHRHEDGVVEELVSKQPNEGSRRRGGRPRRSTMRASGWARRATATAAARRAGASRCQTTCSSRW
jgi:hypothetical protein